MAVYRNTTHRLRTASAAALAVLITIFAYGFVASSWIAKALGYVPALGRPLTGHIYPPFAWIAWSFKYYRADPPVFAHAYWIFIVVTVFVLGGAVIVVGISTRKLTVFNDVHGSARFLANADEIRKETGLLPAVGDEGKATGVLLALWQEKVGRFIKRTRTYSLRHAQIEHIQLFGPPGSGKGVAFVFNAINTWDSSMVVLDRKGSLHAMASGFLAKKGYRVLRWSPNDENTIGINILDTIRIGTPHETGDAENFSKSLLPPNARSDNSFFTDGAARLIATVVLYVIYRVRKEQNRKATLADVVAIFGTATATTADLYNALMNNDVGPDGQRHQWIADQGAMAVKGAKSERTDANIFETAYQKLAPAKDPLVQAATAESHFQLDDLMNGPKKIALFLVLPPGESNLQRLSGLFTTILSMMIEIPTRKEIRPEAGKTKIPHERPLMILLDEIGNVGQINALPNALTQLREYGVKIIGIWQSITQINKQYGKDNPILGASEIQMSFAPNDEDTAKWLSWRLGVTTVAIENVQLSGHRFGMGMHNTNQSMGYQKRPLMTEDETTRLPGPTKDANNMVTAPGEILIMKRGANPIRATQALWWEIPVIAENATVPPIAHADSDNTAPPSPPAPGPQSNSGYIAPVASGRRRFATRTGGATPA
ncbi:type IV secretory system conjugative DNA transfer family protein [Acidocella sp.]|uniref:type IV secretory system conjugative DNA transfer family protein n=1 Tax=Acidocella sp. TaxID=50710 RepID=UPI003D016992